LSNIGSSSDETNKKVQKELENIKTAVTTPPTERFQQKESSDFNKIKSGFGSKDTPSPNAGFNSNITPPTTATRRTR